MLAVRNDTTLTPAEKRARLQAIRTQMREAIKQILTPEQQAQIEQMRAERHSQRANGGQSNAARHSGGLNG